MRRAALIALVTLLRPVLSYAQASDTEVAKQRSQTGQLHYERGEFEKALAEFHEAYRLSPRPELQYNIAQAHERLAAHEAAIAAYEAYLAGKPEARDRKFVQSRIDFLKQQIAEKNSDTTIIATSDQATAPTRGKRIFGWTALGVGGAAVITGIAFGIVARSKASELEDANANQKSWADVQHLEDEGQRAETISIVALVVGGVAIAGGALLLWLDQREQHTNYSFRSNGLRLIF